MIETGFANAKQDAGLRRCQPVGIKIGDGFGNELKREPLDELTLFMAVKMPFLGDRESPPLRDGSKVEKG